MTTKFQRRVRQPRGSFARLVDVADISDEGIDLSIAATPDECLAVANAIDLPAVTSLSARFSIVPRPGDRFAVAGKVTAHVTQICVVTLDPFETVIEQPVDLVFERRDGDLPARFGADQVRRERSAEPSKVCAAGDDDRDPPDPIVDGVINLGAIAVEFVVLACDPYPRKPGAAFADVVAGEGVPSAFAALARLKAHP